MLSRRRRSKIWGILGMLHKLSIGTAQFGLDYGITNKRGKVPKEEAIAIIHEALRLGIRTFDTAAEYGEAEAILDEALAGRHNITVTRKWAAGQLRRCNSDIKRGISVYTREEIEGALDIMPVHIVQLPLNVLDQRFLQDGTIDWLKGLGVEVHARSVFLQGALLAAPPSLPAPLCKVVSDLWTEWSTPIAHGMLFACLQFVLGTPVDRLVVGVTSVDELRQIVDAARVKWVPEHQYLWHLACDDESIINPTQWKEAA